jgi:hypothetical protein
MDAENKEFTHTAWAQKWVGQKFSHLMEVGSARIDGEGKVHVFLDRMPVGGFNGYIYVSPIGVKPPSPKQEPKRPGEASAQED